MKVSSQVTIFLNPGLYLLYYNQHTEIFWISLLLMIFLSKQAITECSPYKGWVWFTADVIKVRKAIMFDLDFSYIRGARLLQTNLTDISLSDSVSSTKRWSSYSADPGFLGRNDRHPKGDVFGERSFSNEARSASQEPAVTFVPR